MSNIRTDFRKCEQLQEQRGARHLGMCRIKYRRYRRIPAPEECTRTAASDRSIFPSVKSPSVNTTTRRLENTKTNRTDRAGKPNLGENPPIYHSPRFNRTWEIAGGVHIMRPVPRGRSTRRKTGERVRGDNGRRRHRFYSLLFPLCPLESIMGFKSCTVRIRSP